MSPYRIRKRGATYAIVKLLAGGHTRTVGHSRTRANAAASIRVRNEAEGKKRRRRRRK